MFAHVISVLIKKKKIGVVQTRRLRGGEQTSFKFYCVAEVTPRDSRQSLVLHLVMPLRNLDSRFIQTGISFEILLCGLGRLIEVRVSLNYL